MDELNRAASSNQVAFSSASKNANSGCSEVMMMAEQEMAAFFRAVTELFGTEQANLSADDWLNELMANDVLPASSSELRSITARASSRLATRVDYCVTVA